MKKLVLVLTICLFTLVTFSQEKKPETKPAQIALTDSTNFISLKDLQQFDIYLQDKFTVKEYGVIMQGLQAVIQKAAARKETN